MAIVELTGADDGTTVSVRPDDQIVLRLPENPTTGYRWELAPNQLIEVLSDTVELGDQPGFGSGGMRVLRLRPITTGSGQLQLRHWQPWEGETSVTHRFAVNVEVLG